MVAGDLDAERQTPERSRVLNELLARGVEGALKATFNSTDGLVHLIHCVAASTLAYLPTWPGWRLAKTRMCNITAAPDDTVTMVYPRTGNERGWAFVCRQP